MEPAAPPGGVQEVFLVRPLNVGSYLRNENFFEITEPSEGYMDLI
jgi:hypothetical protein